MDSSPSPFGLQGLSQWLQQRRHLVLDGALATELERRGADLKDPLWSAKLLMAQPELIQAVHLDYFRAGADVATTASYQATFEGFAQRGLGADEAARLMHLSVQLARDARDTFWAEAAAQPHHTGRARPIVAASVGPYGAMLADGSEYRGHYAIGEDALMTFHRPRLAVLAQAGADLLAVETIPCLAEARAVARLLRTEWPDTPAWLSFSCADGEHNNQGERLADCVSALEDFAQIVAIGVNCTAPQHVASLMTQARSRTAKPLLVYPNAGETYDAVSKQWVPAGHALHTPFAEQAMAWADAGATLIGGCCRTSPADIGALFRRWSAAG